ncbi:hypothetical protein C9439_02475 [archaeon SCG-AAA382B04]|nr:hypothetical protein C9439_02475 [archaeon SCG-AAA382B04]
MIAPGGFEPPSPGPKPSKNGLFSFSEQDIQLYLDRLRGAGRTEKRVKDLSYRLFRFAKYVDFECNLETVVDYQKERLSDVSKRTVLNDTQAIKQFLLDNDCSWANKIKRPSVDRKKPPNIKKTDISKTVGCLDEAPNEEKYVLRAKTALILSSATGLRPTELKRLVWENINLNNRLIDLPAEKTKNRVGRTVVFNDEAKQLLLELRKSFPEIPFKRRPLYLVTKKINPRPEIKLKHCRKFFSQEWDRQGLPTSIKKMLMGHFGSIDLSNYNSQTPEDLKEIYDKGDFEIDGLF